jgi:hypothetical protein
MSTNIVPHGSFASRGELRWYPLKREIVHEIAYMRETVNINGELYDCFHTSQRLYSVTEHKPSVISKPVGYYFRTEIFIGSRHLLTIESTSDAARYRGFDFQRGKIVGRLENWRLQPTHVVRIAD